MNGTLDDQYFEWLYRQIGAVRNRNPSRSYWKLARKLFTKEFRWIVPNDDNRISDAMEVREQFVREELHGFRDPDWMGLGCSMLEMLIALCHRISFESDRTAGDWFWKLMQNLELRDYTDNKFNRQTEEHIDECLDRVINRTYEPTGRGGLFPLAAAMQDQRNVEIWYQMSAYLLENEHWDVSPH